MAQKFKLLVGTGKNQVAQTIDIEQGVGNQAYPVTVKAQAGMRYQLAQANSPQAPHNVRAKRVGKDLQVFLEDSKQADLVIQNYYDEIPANVNALVGQAENGTVYSYIPENANATGLVPNLADGGNTVGMALGNYEEFMLAGAPVAAAGGMGLGVLAAGLGLAALAGGGGGGGGSTSAAVTPIAATTPTGQTGALATASDSGTAGDNLTQVKSPTIVGKAEANAQVEVTINGKIYRTTADANGNYSVIIPNGDALPDGTYIPQIKVINATGESTANGTPFTIDTSTSVVITDPGKGTTTNAISGTGEAGATVVVKDAQNTTIGTAVVDSNGRWTLTPTTAVVVGQISATATDPAGNTANALSNNTGVAPPAPAITSVTDNAQGQTGSVQKYVTGNIGGLDKGVTNDNTPTVSGTAAPGATVTLYDAGKLVGTATVGPDGQWSITPTLTTEGVHTFTARATLAAMSSPDTGEYPIYLDTTNPTTPVVDPTGNSTNTGTGTGNTYAVIDTVGSKTGIVVDQSTIDDATPTINGKGEVGATITIYDKNQLLGTALVGADGKWSFKPSTPFANGSTHTITTTVTDTGGNTSAISGSTTFTIDTSNTPVQLTSVIDDVSANTGPLSQNALTNDNKPTLTGTGTPNTTITIADKGSPIGTAVVDAQGNWTFTPTTALSEGAHSFVVSGTDKANNPSSTVPFVLTIDTQAPATPVISVFADDVGTVQNANTPTAQYTDDTTPTLKGTAEANSTVTIKDASGTVVAVTTADSTGHWSYTLSRLAEQGNYTYTATATDAAGNISGNSNTFSLTLDTTAPSGQTGALAAVASSDSGTLGDNITSVRTPTITGSAEANAKVEVTVNGKTYITTADATGNYSVSIPTGDALSANTTYTPAIKVTDAAGNTSTANGTPFTVTAAPTNAGVGLAITIRTDADNDGNVNAAELGSPPSSTFTSHITVNNTAVVGDKVIISASNGSTALTPITRVLTATDIANGFDVSFAKPAEGTVQTVSANYMDSVGNPATDAPKTDSATLDTTAYNGVLTLNSILDDVTPQPDGTNGSYTYNTTGGTTNDTSPLIQGTVGTLAAGETVHIFRGLVDIGIATVNTSNGTWTFQDGMGAANTATAPLTNGATYTYTAKVIDAANNVSTPTTGFAITIDTSAPTLVADVANATEASATSSGNTAANFGANPRGNLLSNDSLGSGSKLSSITGTGAAIAVSNGSTDINNPSEIVGTYGTLKVGADGSYTYFLNNDNATVDALNANSIGLTDSFSYSVKNAAGATQSSTLTVNIHGAADFQSTTGTVAGTGSLTQAYWSQFENGFIDHVGLIPDFDGDGKIDLVFDQRYAIPSAMVLSSQDYAAADAADGNIDGKITTSNILKQAHSFAITVAQNGTSLSADSAIASMGDVDGDGLSDFLASFHNPAGATNSISNYFLSSKDLSSVLALQNHTITEDQISTLAHSYSFATGNNWHSSPLALNLSNSIAGKEMVLTSTFDAWLVSPSNFEAMDLADGTNDNIVSLSQNFNTTATGGTAFYYHIHNNTGNTLDRSVGNIGDAGDLDHDGLREMMMYDPYAGQSTGDAAFYLLNSKDLAQLSALSGTANTINVRDVNLGTNSYEFRGATVGSNRIDMERAGDVNGDGKGDVLMSSMRDGTVWLVSGNDLETLDNADSTNDNQVDLNNVSKGASSYVLNSNLANYADLAANAGMHRAFGIGDIDGDGKSDLFLKNDVTGVGYIVLAKDLATMDANGDHKINIDTDWNKAGTSGYKITGLSTQFTNDANATDSGLKLVSSGDIDGDGLSDFVVAEGDLGTIRTFLSSKLATYDAADSSTDHTIAASATGTSTVAGSVNNDILGSSGNDVLSGGSNDNTIYGNGGSDVIYAGAGNDRIVLNASNVAALGQTGAYIDGGTGTDTLVLDGAGINFDFTTLQSKVSGIEKIDLTGTGNNTLKLSLADVLAVSDTHNLYVTGNAGDSVQIKAASVPAATTAPINGITYNDYNLDGTHHLYVQQGVNAVFVA